MLIIGIGQTLRPHSFPRHRVGYCRGIVNVHDNLPDEWIIGARSKITRCNQAWLNLLILPTSKRLQFKPLFVEWTQTNAVGIHGKTTLSVQNFPPHHVGNPIQLA